MRFAAYWVPDETSALWHFGCRWLGRDAATGATFPALDARHGAITADPRRYGFHATLKAPIALCEGRSADDVGDALAAVAARFAPFTTAAWVLADIDGFLALVPDPDIEGGRPTRLHALADACVLALEPLRRPASPAEIARRSPERLPPLARAYLHRFGYPWVFETFYTHMTLTCRLAQPERETVAGALRCRLRALPAEPYRFDAIALFVEERPGGPFRLAGKFPLGAQR